MLFGLLLVAIVTIAQCNAAPPADSQFELALEQAHQRNIDRIGQLLRDAQKSMAHGSNAGNATATRHHPSLRPRRALMKAQEVTGVLWGQCEPGQKTCCPHVAVVDVEEVDLGAVVVAPRKFHSVVCFGECTGPRCNGTDSLSTETSGCRPVAYGAQKVIWLAEDDQLFKREISTFYATRCACGV